MTSADKLSVHLPRRSILGKANADGATDYFAKSRQPDIEPRLVFVSWSAVKIEDPNKHIG